MPAARDLLTHDGLQALQLVGLRTGLNDLDHLTHGLLPGSLWVIAATPGAGRTTLASQFAGQVAADGASVALLSARDERAALLTNLLASQAKVPAQHLQRGELSDEESARLARAKASLSTADLQLLCPTDGSWVYADGQGDADLTSLMSSGRRVADLLVVDDLDELLGEDWIKRVPGLRAWAQHARFALVVTVAAEDVAAFDICCPSLRRHADVLVRLALPGQFDLDDPRLGEADLDVLRNRQGAQGRITVHFQGHYRRFLDP